MRITTFNEPWPHGVVYNTYNLVKFEKARDELSLLLTDLTLKRSYRKTPFTLLLTRTSFPFSYDLVEEFDLHDFFNKVKPNFNHRPFNRLKQSLLVAGACDYPHEIHYETENKIFSFVTYISPVSSTGTVLYDLNKNKVKEVQWKPNHSFFFCGQEGVTWHSFCAGYWPRITLLRFLVTA